MSCSVGKTKLLPVQFQFQNWIIKFRKDLRVVIDSSVESLEYEHHLPKKKINKSWARPDRLLRTKLRIQFSELEC